MKTCYWIIIPSVRKRLLNRHSSWWDVVVGRRGWGAGVLSKPNPRSEKERRRSSKETVSSFPPPSFLSRFCFAVRSSPPPPPSLFLVISSSRRPVSPDETLNWQSAFEGVNIAPPSPSPLPPRGGRCFLLENNLEKPRFEFSLSLVEIYKKGGREEGGGGKGKFFTHFSGNV